MLFRSKLNIEYFDPNLSIEEDKNETYDKDLQASSKQRINCNETKRNNNKAYAIQKVELEKTKTRINSKIFVNSRNIVSREISRKNSFYIKPPNQKKTMVISNKYILLVIYVITLIVSS